MTADQRGRALDRLASGEFELLVIGAGIIGSRIAYEAARLGLKVALVDAGDFGGATSSASSKLIHGGLRYLQMGDLGLVRESHQERKALLGVMAPHLVRPLTFLLPVYRGGPHRVPAIAAGLLLYSALSSFRRSRARLLTAAAARALVPDLRVDGLGWVGQYEDAQTNDSRLVLATVAGAMQLGAVAVNHARVVGLDRPRGGAAEVAVRPHEGGEVRVAAKAVVNAAGPWVDTVRRMEDVRAEPMARLSKGVHLLLPLPPSWSAALTVPIDGSRVTFAVPWEGMLMLGTTDTVYEGEPADVSVSAADVAAVLAEAAAGLPPELIAPELVRFSFAGLRVLPAVAGDTASAPREHLVSVGPGGMVSVAGGKLTTHRRIALDVLARVPGVRAAALRRLVPAPLPGAGTAAERPLAVDPEVWEHLVHLYGSEAGELVAYQDAVPAGLERVHPQGPDVWAEVHHAIASEWALTVDDVVRRRTTLAVRGLAGPEVRVSVARLLGNRPPPS